MPGVPLVSVVFTSHNHARFVEESLESVLSQSFRDLEVLALDDASTDDSLERLRRVGDSRVTVFSSEVNRGRHHRNWAICNSRGAFIAFQNSDDLWHPEKLARQMEFLDANPSCGACFTVAEICDDSGSPCPDHPVFGGFFQAAEEPDRFGWLRRFFLSGNCLAQPSAVVRKDVLGRTGPFDPSLYQLPDLDLWIRAAAVTDLAVLPAALTRFRVHGDGGNFSTPSPAVQNRHDLEAEEILKRYAEPPILADLPRVFGLPEDEGISAEQRDSRNLARLGFCAASLPGGPHRRAAIHFLREALRRGDRTATFSQSERSRIVHHLIHVSSEVAGR